VCNARSIQEFLTRRMTPKTLSYAALAPGESQTESPLLDTPFDAA
jgi:hypothetical protein